MEEASNAGYGLSDTQQMMYAFGDTRRPNAETAKIMESVVLAQVTDIIHESVSVAIAKQGEEKSTWNLTLEDIIFIMRHNPVKVQRMIKYLKTREFIKKNKNASDGDVDGVGSNGEKVEGRLLTRCKEFIQKIDQSGKLLAACDEEYFDEVKQKRLHKNEIITRNMDNKRYEEFCKARVVGFRGQYSVKFQQNLLEVYSSLETGASSGKIENLAKEVFSYLAYETLGQLVEMCLILRRDSESDPVCRQLAPGSLNLSFPQVQLPLPDKPGGLAAAGDQSLSKACPPISPAELREVVRRLKHHAASTRPLAMGRVDRTNDKMPLIAIS